MLNDYWGDAHSYHHTSYSALNYGLLEALLLAYEEGIDNRVARHLRNHHAFLVGIEAMGLQMHVASQFRLPMLNMVRIPDGVDDAAVRRYLLENFNLEIGGGLGVIKDKVWRIGLMGYSSSAEKILFLLSAMNVALAAQGVSSDLVEGQNASMNVLQS